MELMLKPLKLIAPCKDYIWGGTKLKKWGKTGGERIAESWELSLHRDGLTKIEGEDITLKAYFESYPQAAGENVLKFSEFPVLIKLIDAENNLSVQVHPSDEYARIHEGQLGKTEMWYIVDAEEGAGIYYGLNQTLTKEQFVKSVADGSITRYMNFVKVKRGQAYFVPSGMLHAICKGITVCEVQQSSNVTYRVYDYGRLGADGRPRQLHIEKAAETANLNASVPNPVCAVVNVQSGAEIRRLSQCKYFKVSEVSVRKNYTGYAGQDSFHALTVIEGSGKVESLNVAQGDTVLIPAGYREYKIDGCVRYILTSV